MECLQGYVEHQKEYRTGYVNEADIDSIEILFYFLLLSKHPRLAVLHPELSNLLRARQVIRLQFRSLLDNLIFSGVNHQGQLEFFRTHIFQEFLEQAVAFAGNGSRDTQTLSQFILYHKPEFLVFFQNVPEQEYLLMSEEGSTKVLAPTILHCACMSYLRGHTHDATNVTTLYNITRETTLHEVYATLLEGFGGMVPEGLEPIFIAKFQKPGTEVFELEFRREVGNDGCSWHCCQAGMGPIPLSTMLDGVDTRVVPGLAENGFLLPDTQLWVCLQSKENQGAAQVLPHRRCLKEHGTPGGRTMNHNFAPAGSKSSHNRTSASEAMLPPLDLTIDYNHEAIRQAAKRPKLLERRKQMAMTGSENPPLAAANVAGVAAMTQQPHLGVMRNSHSTTDSGMQLQQVDGGKEWGSLKRPKRLSRQGEKTRSCFHPTCDEGAVWKRPGENGYKQGACTKHRGPDMTVNMKGNVCVEPGCLSKKGDVPKRASYGYTKSNLQYCAKHRKEGMVDYLHKKGLSVVFSDNCSLDASNTSASADAMDHDPGESIYHDGYSYLNRSTNK